MPVGDITSSERGTGARFNDGKVRVDYLLFTDLARLLRFSSPYSPGPIDKAIEAMKFLGYFQESGNVEELITMLDVLYSDWSGDLGISVFDTMDHSQMIADSCAVFDYGAKKYAAWNWAKGMAWSVPVACIGRHLQAIILGEQDDPESGLPHLGHIACNVFMLMKFSRDFTEGNDLPVMPVKAKS